MQAQLGESGIGVWDNDRPPTGTRRNRRNLAALDRLTVEQHQQPLFGICASRHRSFLMKEASAARAWQLNLT
jgi:hypothetical protein